MTARYYLSFISQLIYIVNWLSSLLFKKCCLWTMFLAHEPGLILFHMTSTMPISSPAFSNFSKILLNPGHYEGYRIGHPLYSVFIFLSFAVIVSYSISFIYNYKFWLTLSCPCKFRLSSISNKILVSPMYLNSFLCQKSCLNRFWYLSKTS